MNFLAASIVVLFPAAFALEFLAVEAEFNSKFVKFIETINNVERFDSIFLLRTSKDQYYDDIFIRNFSISLGIPVILATEVSSFHLKRKFNANLLTIVQFEENDFYLQRLLEFLQLIRFCKIIFLLKHSTRNVTELKSVFDFCFKNRMINVLAVFQDFETSSAYYSFNNFGEFQIEEFLWNEKDSNIYRDKMHDLRGAPFPVVFGGKEPGVIISKNENGDTVIGGYVGNTFKAFAKRHNASLNNSSVRSSLTEYDLHKLVLNGTTEISGGGLIFLENSFEWYTYPYTLFDWGVMLPVEPNIPIYKVFVYVFDWKAFGIVIVLLILLSVSLEATAYFLGPHRFFFKRKLICNIDCLRGLLGQSFSQTPTASISAKILYSLIFLLGIMIVTSYDAFLQSFMTQPPSEKVIRSFEDLQKSDLKILTFQPDMDELLIKLRPKFMKKYSNVFLGETSMEAFYNRRDSFDTKYAYTVTEMKWYVYEYQQKFLGQKLFRRSEELVLVKNVLAAISINENSIYKQILNFHILETQSSGLMDYWIKGEFYELIKIGKIKKIHFEFDEEVEPLKVEDLKWVWILMGFALMVAFLCFVGEIFVFKWLLWNKNISRISNNNNNNNNNLFSVRCTKHRNDFQLPHT
ncbi:uncharacterized protein LOC129918090 [Episyrphus balteatus]|uniref:uncharacterized protein LOC129918090 n=1 Tax=Episyrphus balteatus TaxID=286459 RepID=UPI002486B096|nr:uncharacterized protein LOC129918090 [Episyrphus balteatus]